jgi:hypothetical protein
VTKERLVDDLIYPLKWVTVKDGVVTEHEREEVFSSNWEKAFGKGYVPAARIAELEALLKEAKEVLRDVVADENCWGDRAEALLARLEED